MATERNDLKTEKEKVPIKKSLYENHEYLKERLDMDINYDVGFRSYKLGNKYIHFYYINGLSDSQSMIQILRQISMVDRESFTGIGAFKELFEHSLTHVQVEIIERMDEVTDQLLSGLMVILGESWDKGLAVDVRSYPNRNPEEPDTERVIRGSRDGYTENIVINTALTRRRIRDERLRMEMIQVGERSKTDICISYIKDVANPNLVRELKELLERIDVDGMPMGEKLIEEFILKQKYNPFPKVRYTERPDVAAAHLFEGHVIIMIDTSPAVIIMPTTYFHHLQHAEEFRQSPATGLYIRWVRFLGILASLFLLPLWILFVFEPEMVPEAISFIGPQDKDYSIPIFWQFLIAELGIDLMRMAAIHTPTPLATAMGLVAAILIGEIAINVGLFIPEIILYLAIAAVGTFATPSYELSIANKLIRLFLLLAVYLFKAPGFILCTTIVFVFLTVMKSLNTPYLWPFIPFNLKGFLSVLLRFTSPMNKTRPSIVRPQNKLKQPTS